MARQTLTAQQTAFFTQNGYLELEGIAYDENGLFSRKTNYLEGRDLWRNEPVLQALLTQTLSSIVLSLIQKPQIRLALDQYVPSDYTLGKPSSLNDLFSIQGLCLGALFTSPFFPPLTSPTLGINPFPSKSGNLLFVKPNILVDWPKLKKVPGASLYIAMYAMPAAVYVKNPNDPCSNWLKAFGYGFGDRLMSAHHPLIFK